MLIFWKQVAQSIAYFLQQALMKAKRLLKSVNLLLWKI